jgi:hypothetical protein
VLGEHPLQGDLAPAWPNKVGPRHRAQERLRDLEQRESLSAGSVRREADLFEQVVELDHIALDGQLAPALCDRHHLCRERVEVEVGEAPLAHN